MTCLLRSVDVKSCYHKSLLSSTLRSLSLFLTNVVLGKGFFLKNRSSEWESEVKHLFRSFLRLLIYWLCKRVRKPLEKGKQPSHIAIATKEVGVHTHASDPVQQAALHTSKPLNVTILQVYVPNETALSQHWKPCEFCNLISQDFCFLDWYHQHRNTEPTLRLGWSRTDYKWMTRLNWYWLVPRIVLIIHPFLILSITSPFIPFFDSVLCLGFILD